MPPVERRVAISVGVADAPPLDYLPAALNGARRFHEWATALGYEATLVTDESEPLTMERLCTELENVLGTGTPPIHRLVLYFAGHGLIREAEEGLWLLSDWHRRVRAVAMEPLRRRLSKYGISQIAIFSDACRSLPRNIDDADLTPDGLLGNGPLPRTDPDVDKFVAAQDGAEAYALPGESPEDDRCLFSGVLLEALWGLEPAAFSPAVTGCVTSRSLAKYLKEQVPVVATRYGRTLQPRAWPTFAEGDDVYFRKGTGIAAPPLPDWPPPKTLGFSPPPVAVAPPADVAFIDLGDAAAPRRVHRQRLTLAQRLDALQPPSGQVMGAGLMVEGEAVRRLWVPQRVQAASVDGSSTWRVDHFTVRPGIIDVPTALVELADGAFASSVALPDFVTTMLCDGRGVQGLVYRSTVNPPGNDPASHAISLLERGTLRASAAMDLAVELRQQKHLNPVLGVVSAYLYDAIGDVDSIRRMAYAYVEHYQPIPFDIAFLGRLQGFVDGDQLSALVPPVPAREPRTAEESRYAWTHDATPERRGTVAGLWPWMRQGWPYLSDPDDSGSTLVLPGLIELEEHVKAARFTTFDEAGARSLIARLGLTPREEDVQPALAETTMTV